MYVKRNLGIYYPIHRPQSRPECGQNPQAYKEPPQFQPSFVVIKDDVAEWPKHYCKYDSTNQLKTRAKGNDWGICWVHIVLQSTRLK